MVRLSKEDEVYAAWLDLLGSDEIYDPDPDIRADLKAMHDAAEASHKEIL